MVAALLAGIALATPTVGCARHVETDAVSAQQRREALRVSVQAHGVTFWGLRQAEQQRFGGRLRFHKSGVTVRHGAPMTVAIAPRDRGWLALRYGSVGEDGVPTLRFTPCAPDTPRFTDRRPIGEETAWAGGFVVLRPGCATLRLRRDGETRWRQVGAGFGMRCRT
jgi:hypothetical protein